MTIFVGSLAFYQDAVKFSMKLKVLVVTC